MLKITKAFTDLPLTVDLTSYILNPLNMARTKANV